MKKLAVIVFAAAFTTGAFGQKSTEKDVPVPVKKAFDKEYPQLQIVKWEKEGSNYEVEFKTDKTNHSILFDAKGNVLEREIQMAVHQLPKPVLAYIRANYAGQKIKEAARITNAKGEVTYEAEIKGKDLVFDTNGKLIKG